MLPSSAFPVSIAILGAALACISDLRARVIPNRLSLGLLALGVLGQLYVAGLVGGIAALASALICAALPLFLFIRGALGGGDVKLFAALGALLGAGLGLELQLVAFALLALFGIALVTARGGLWAFLRASLRASLALVMPRRAERALPEPASLELPMAGAIFAAVLVVCIKEWWR